MKFYLVKDSPLRQKRSYFLPTGDFTFSITFNGIVPVNQGNPEEVKLCDRIRNRLFPVQDPPTRNDSLLVALSMTDNEAHVVTLRIGSDPVISTLVDLFGPDVKIQVTIINFGNDRLTLGTLKSTEMKPYQNGQYHDCEDPKFFQADPEYLFCELALLHYCPNVTGLVTVTVTVNQSALVDAELTVQDKQVYRKMLLEGIRSDVVIIPGNGEQVKGHTSVLASHSTVFNAIFQSDMKEAKTHTIQMPDMSEEAVRALLAYLYYCEDSVPNSKPGVAFEMFYAGHKYDIPVLEGEMKKLLLGKPDQWYTAESALKLYLFAKNLSNGQDDLKRKAVKGLKLNARNLKESPTYIALFKEDPEAAMELFEYVIATL